MQIGERVDQRKADMAVQFGPAGELRRDVVADHEAVPALLDDKHGADDALVLAQQEASRCERKAPVQHRQHAMLAPHVMRAGWDRPERRPPQHELAITEADQVGEIRLAAAELPHRKRTLRAVKMLAQIRLEPRRVQPLIRPLVDQLSRF